MCYCQVAYVCQNVQITAEFLENRQNQSKRIQTNKQTVHLDVIHHLHLKTACLLYLSVILHKLPHKVDSILHILRSHRFSNAVHRQLRQSHIHRVDALSRAHNRPYRAPSDLILPQHELLERNLLLLTNHLYDRGGQRRRGVSLLTMCFNDHSLIQRGFVIGLVHGREAGMHGVRHILPFIAFFSLLHTTKSCFCADSRGPLRSTR